ncbi:hypothetical protein LCW_07820 [Latilactobacillus curvatus]|uniref:phage head closure protein n=1 Tax=Latilactobacillus curvatus TaxID=28038 RepID=UPI000849FEAE|nr:phage head closure protein [Latilactobacillus curvatus]AOO75965.1 hypothetical protein LCW_07820 [Latilactobacillus curvatus]
MQKQVRYSPSDFNKVFWFGAFESKVNPNTGVSVPTFVEKEKMHYKAQRKTITQRYALVGTALENTSIIVIRHSKLSDQYQYLKIVDKTYKIIDCSIDDSNNYMTYDFLTIKESKGVN